MSKKTWSVCIPVTGVIYLDVQADSERDAIQAALNSDELPETPDEWEICEQIVTGNVFRGHTNKASAELVDDGEEG